MSGARFDLGQTVVTPGALKALEEAVGEIPGLVLLLAMLQRHGSGDWGEVCAEDRKANERALEDGTRILSAYTVEGVKLWIITEADRSSTCVLLPSEY